MNRCIAALLVLAACSDEPTYLLTTITRGNVPADTPIRSLETTIELDGNHDMTPMLEAVAGGEFALPTTLTLELPSSRGLARVGANAYGDDRLLLSAGSTELTLAPGEVIPVTVELGRNAMPPPDGGVDESVLAISPPIIDFSTITIGTTATRTFTVGNSGNGASLPLHIGFADSGPFSIVDNTCDGLALPPTDACSFGVRFAPLEVNTWGTTLEVEHYDQLGNGIAGGAVLFSLDPPTLNLGSVAVDDTVSATVTVSNPSSSATGPLSFAIDGADAIEFSHTTGGSNCPSGAPLAAGASCTVTIHFTPRSQGARSARLKVTDGVMMPLTLNGTGV